MKNLIVFASLLAILVSCNQEAKKSTDAEPAKKEEITVKELTVSEVLAAPAKYKDADATITGMVIHVCKHGGQKLFIIEENPDERLKVIVGDGIAEFDVALEGSTVEFTGKLVEVTEEAAAAMAEEHEEHEEHHEGDEAHAKADNASYSFEASSFKELETEVK